MRLAIAALALILTAGLAPAQQPNCPGGKCPTAPTSPFGWGAYAPRYQLAPQPAPTVRSTAGPTAPDHCPFGEDYRWASLPGVGWGWVHRSIPIPGESVPAAPAAVGGTPALALPPVGATAEDDRWRPGVVLIRAYLVQRIVREGRTRDQAERIVAKLGDRQLLKWLVENREKIFDVIEKLLPLLLLILDDGPDVPPMPVPNLK